MTTTTSSATHRTAVDSRTVASRTAAGLRLLPAADTAALPEPARLVELEHGAVRHAQHAQHAVHIPPAHIASPPAPHPPGLHCLAPL